VFLSACGPTVGRALTYLLTSNVFFAGEASGCLVGQAYRMPMRRPILHRARHARDAPCLPCG
jgi:hypothetical protein